MNIFVVESWRIVAICGSRFIQCCQTDSGKTDFGYQNYMGEVSRLLITSPRPRLMETIILNIFSPSRD